MTFTALSLIGHVHFPLPAGQLLPHRTVRIGNRPARRLPLPPPVWPGSPFPRAQWVRVRDVGHAAPGALVQRTSRFILLGHDRTASGT